MTVPSDDDNAAAKAFLEEWVPGFTTGQWGALAELLAERRDLVAAPKREAAA